MKLSLRMSSKCIQKGGKTDGSSDVDIRAIEAAQGLPV